MMNATTKLSIHHQKVHVHHLATLLTFLLFIFSTMFTPVHQKEIVNKNLELGINIGLWLWLAIFNVLDQENYSWSFYLTCLLLLLPTQLPSMALAWYKNNGKKTLSPKSYQWYWLVCYLIVLPLFTSICFAFAPQKFDDFFFIYAALANFGLAVLLSANAYYQKKVKHYKWLQQLGLENAVLISLILISLTIAIMAVSSLNNPTYHNKERLLIGYEFSLSKIILNFGAFLSFFFQFLLIYLSGYLFFFINNKFLVPKILRQRGLILYVLSLLSAIALLYPILGQILISLPINKVLGRDIFSDNPFTLENAFGAMGVMLLSLPIVLSIQWARQNTRILSLEREKSQTELDLLRQQLNPHFFFNTLNNLYALSLQKSDQTLESILQLSALMRYTIYKGSEERVLLQEELKYIEDYIQLQQIRLKKPLVFNFEQQISSDQIIIAPLLLIVLVENAFKHGIEPAEDKAFLNLKLVATTKEIYFSCENSFEPLAGHHEKGIGLDNLRKRLALLYPNQHTLLSSSNSGVYKTTLQINLS